MYLLLGICALLSIALWFHLLVFIEEWFIRKVGKKKYDDQLWLLPIQLFLAFGGPVIVAYIWSLLFPEYFHF